MNQNEDQNLSFFKSKIKNFEEFDNNFENNTLSTNEIENYKRKFENISMRLNSGKQNWINSALQELRQITGQRNSFLFSIFQDSPAYDSLINFAEKEVNSTVLGIFINILSISPLATVSLISNGLIQLVFESIFYDDSQIVEKSIAIIWNLVCSSQVSRASLIASDFVNKIATFLDQFPLIKHSQKIAKSFYFTLSYLFSKKTAPKEDFYSESDAINILNEMESIKTNIALNAYHGSFLQIFDDSYFVCFYKMIFNIDNTVSAYGLKILNLFENEIDIVQSFLNYKGFVSQLLQLLKREDDTITLQVFHVLGNFMFLLDFNVKEVFSENNVYEYVFQNCYNQNELIRSQCIDFLNQIVVNDTRYIQLLEESSFFDDILENFDNKSVREKDCIMWLFFNISYESPKSTIKYLINDKIFDTIFKNIEIFRQHTVELIFKTFQDIFSRQTIDSEYITKLVHLFEKGDCLDILESFSEIDGENGELAESLLNLFK